jgi:phospholipase/carboxylesterase
MHQALPDTLAHVVRPAERDPAGALVLLHGRGADEHDLYGFLDILDPQRRLLGATLGGPLALPPGGRHWYVVPRVGFPEPRTFADSYALLEDWLAGLSTASGIPSDRVVLGGFSQGAVMALALGLGAGRPTPGGIIAMSGFVPSVAGWEPDVERPGLPVFVTHGRRDPVIPVEFGRATRDLLEPSPVDLTYVETDAGHHVDPRTLAMLPAWLEREVVLAAPKD